ncbi:PTS lactose/cellobiose transporter subunit IIA [Collinsella vaginalis]|uniref:PTS lactose/cellobiose transporter subunit IIA n=1 Tax=Collinsella vaginalis TaxID=1870987 RepID=UPI000A26C615|nr:PTS lactose/cellobiose transporter subunit IIA [Collinsella vaginalis]
MTSFDELARVSFEIIASVGMARSSYIEAIQEAKAGNFDRARALVDEGGESFLGGHDAHTALVQAEAGGERTEMGLLLTHAEDQLMSAEAFGILSTEFIALYERIDRLEKRLDIQDSSESE